MPKIKSHRGAAKRFKFTGTGKIMRAKGYKSHLLTGKTRKRKRSLRKKTVVNPVSVTAIKRILPYGS